ncbi:EamA-like transporter family protein [Shimia gijangensis]|uniref:EamA-like transporter family protein n=1 Tax=Shimia gijangensis TaxID=1470563 RepID=A0A1M6BA64_9RHOB|nr:DMT family transporter [Shimia gijangensis]SHI45631.1 EamA-like transporter family protein [Shimia gijangensis]
MSVTGPDTARFDTAARHRQVLSGNALGIAAVLSWSVGFPAAELLLTSWPPLALITGRFVISVCVLMVLWLSVDGPSAVINARWGRGTLVGSVTFGLGAYLLLLAQYFTDPVTVAIIASTTPIAATLVEMVTGNRRLSGMFAFGLGASVIGGIVATGSADVGNLGLGALSAITSGFLFSIGSHCCVRDLPSLSPIGRSAVTLAGGLLFAGGALIISHTLGMEVLPNQPVDASQIGLLLIYALAGMAFSQVMWIACVGRLGVALASFHMNVAPFYVMLIMLALGAGWNWGTALGAGIVIIGVILAQTPPPRRRV